MCLPAFSNHYRYHTTCAILPNLGASSGEAGIWGMDSRGARTGYRLGQQQLRCQTRVALPGESRDHCPVPTGRQIASTRGTYPRREEKRHSRLQVDIQVVSIQRAMQKHTTGENMFHRRRADSDDSPRNESVPTLVRVTGRSLRSPPPEIKTLRKRLLPLVR